MANLKGIGPSKKDAELIKAIAFYFEGVKAGRGSISPFGFEDLKRLWTLYKKIA